MVFVLRNKISAVVATPMGWFYFVFMFSYANISASGSDKHVLYICVAKPLTEIKTSNPSENYAGARSTTHEYFINYMNYNGAYGTNIQKTFMYMRRIESKVA